MKRSTSAHVQQHAAFWDPCDCKLFIDEEMCIFAGLFILQYGRVDAAYHSIPASVSENVS